MKKLYVIASGLSFATASIAQLTEQNWLTIGFFLFIGGVFFVLIFVGDKP